MRASLDSCAEDRQRFRTNTRDAEVGPLPDGKPANRAFFELFVFGDGSHYACDIIARFHEEKFSRRGIFSGGESAGDARRIARDFQARRFGSGAD